MIAAGFDLASTSGAAILDGGKFVRADCFRSTTAGLEESDGPVFRRFRRWLVNYVSDHHIERAAIEAPLVTNITRKGDDGIERPMVSQRAYLRLYGFRAVALEVFEKYLPEPCIEVPAVTWRAAFLPKGWRRKGQNLKALSLNQCGLLRWKVPNHDAADAAGVAFWLSGHLKTARLVRPGDLFARTGS